MDCRLPCWLSLKRWSTIFLSSQEYAVNWMCRWRYRKKILSSGFASRRVPCRCSQWSFGYFADQTSLDGAHLKVWSRAAGKLPNCPNGEHRVCWIVALDPCQATHEIGDQLWDLLGGATPGSPYLPISVRPFLSAYLLHR